MSNKHLLIFGLIITLGVVLILLANQRQQPSPNIGSSINPAQDLNPQLAYIKDSVVFPTLINQTTIRYLAGQSTEFVDFDTITSKIKKRYPAKLPGLISVDYSPDKTKALIEIEVKSLNTPRFSIYNFNKLTIDSLPPATQAAAWTLGNYLLSAEQQSDQAMIFLSRKSGQKHAIQKTKILANKLYPLNDAGDALVYSADDGRLYKITKGKIELFEDQLVRPPTLSPKLDKLWIPRQGKTELIELASKKVLTVVAGENPTMIVFSKDNQSSYFVRVQFIKLSPNLEPLRQDDLLKIDHPTGTTSLLLPSKSAFQREIQQVVVGDDGLYLINDFTLYKLKLP